MSLQFSRGLQYGLVAALLALIWGAWRPSFKNLPPDLARPQTRGELQRLPAGRDFVLEGRVEPSDAPPGREWQGRFAYVHRQRRDLSGNAGGKTVRLVTVEDHRPAVRLNWSGDDWILPTGSYSLDHAPRVEPRFWPRKWLLTTPVDDWDASSTGFRAGEEAIALGRMGDDGRPRITDLLEAPFEKAVASIGVRNRVRLVLVLAAKILATLFVLSWIISSGRLRGSEGG